MLPLPQKTLSFRYRERWPARASYRGGRWEENKVSGTLSHLCGAAAVSCGMPSRVPGLDPPERQAAGPWRESPAEILRLLDETLSDFLAAYNR